MSLFTLTIDVVSKKNCLFHFAIYYYSVTRSNINSIQHNFLIRGQTQNEGDAAHSVIEKSVTRTKNGCIYVPDHTRQYISLIRGAKKTGKPFVVNGMDFNVFFDLKALEDNTNFNRAKNVDDRVIKTGNIKSIKNKNSENYYYRPNTKRIIDRKQKLFFNPKMDEITLKQNYNNKIPISERKKRDLLQLLEANLVQRYYESFYSDLI